MSERVWDGGGQKTIHEENMERLRNRLSDAATPPDEGQPAEGD